ncbi:hypothetical protein ANN_13572 [Periplaneta americana]|uniref:Sleeping Beauty transposase HTH domain-containing protein n=1 Tax=Periplaneta americana TaxID=6978 RepID=A0ABQ8TLI8_PERAM|nr:hypothetical protein ANN_13572 [Periplaneta americana]
MGRKSQELSAAWKDRIVSLFKQGFSYRKIGKLVKRSHATVQYIIKKFKTGSTDNARRQGRPRVISQRESHQLVREA